MKKIINIFLVLVLLVTISFVLTGCEKTKQTGNGNEGISDEVKTVEYSFTTLSGANIKFKANDGYKLVKNGDADSDYEFARSSNNYALVGNSDFSLEMKTDSYVYHTNIYYKEKFGEITPSFVTFKEYMSSDLRSTAEGKTEKEFKVGSKDAIGLCNSKSWATIYVDYDEFNPKSYFEIDLVPTGEPVSESKTRELLDNEEINKILATFTFSK